MSVTQGSSFLATLGFEAESRQDSPKLCQPEMTIINPNEVAALAVREQCG
jgi:hypothetical protein